MSSICLLVLGKAVNFFRSYKQVPVQESPTGIKFLNNDGGGWFFTNSPLQARKMFSHPHKTIYMRCLLW